MSKIYTLYIYYIRQGSKLLVRIVWIGQSQNKLEYIIAHSHFVIGQFQKCEPTISNSDLRSFWALWTLTANNIYEIILELHDFLYYLTSNA